VSTTHFPQFGQRCWLASTGSTGLVQNSSHLPIGMKVGMESKSLLVVIATRRATEGKKTGALLIVLFAVSPTTKFGVGTAEKF
jgi:hypothetical protein